MSVAPAESLQSGRDVGEAMPSPSKLVSCVSGVGQWGHPAWVGRTAPLVSTELDWPGLGRAGTSCAVLLDCAVLSRAVLQEAAVPCCTVPGCAMPCQAVPLCCAIVGCVLPTRAVLVGASKFFKSEVLSQVA